MSGLESETVFRVQLSLPDVHPIHIQVDGVRSNPLQVPLYPLGTDATSDNKEVILLIEYWRRAERK